MERICKKCNIKKHQDEFVKNQGNLCKFCKKEFDKEYYEKNKSYLKNKSKENRLGNKQKYSEYHKKRYLLKKDDIQQYQKEYYVKNKEHVILRTANYRNKNKEIINKKRRDKDSPYFRKPEYKIAHSLRHRLNKIIKYKERKIHRKTISFLGCTVTELKEHLQSKFLPTMTWENYGAYWHIDHIVPCASFDLLIEEEQKKCFHYTNLQPLFAITQVINDVEYIGNLNKQAKLIKQKQL